MPAWKKGQSGNLNGRPPKDRAIAFQLTKALNKTDKGSDGKQHKRVGLLAEILVNAIMTGKVALVSGQELLLPPREWMELTKFMIGHVDGPAKAQLELSNPEGESFSIGVTAIEYRNGLAAIAPGPVRDSDTPRASESIIDGQAVGQDGPGGCVGLERLAPARQGGMDSSDL